MIEIRSLVTCLISLVVFNASTAQRLQHEWSKSFGGVFSEFGKSMIVGDSGNLYLSGMYGGTVDFDPGTSSFSMTSLGFVDDCYVQKLDSNGNFVWAKSFGGLDDDKVYGIEQDQNGNIYVTGFFKGTADFDPGSGVANMSSNGDFDVYISKLDRNGNFIWARSFGNSFFDRAIDLAIDQHNNVYVVGEFRGTVDFDPGSSLMNRTSNGGYDIYVVKFDELGTFQWVKTIGGAMGDAPRSIEYDLGGSLLISGNFEDSVDFDPGIATHILHSKGASDIFLLKLDTAGNFDWATSRGGSGVDGANTVFSDPSSNIYLIGYFSDSVNFNPGGLGDVHHSQGGIDVFVQKLNSNGLVEWTGSFGGTSIDFGVDISVDLNKNALIVGEYRSTVDFDPGSGSFPLTSKGNDDVFVLKLDSSGSFVDAASFGSNSVEGGHAIANDPSGNVYVHGIFNNTVDFNPGSNQNNLSSNGSDDVFILKLKDCQVYSSIDSISACGPYTWIDGNTYDADNDTSIYMTTTSNGCDSIVSLKLSIIEIDTALTISNDSLYSNELDADRYEWRPCPNDTGVLGQERWFVPNANNGFKVIVYKKGCADTSRCHRVLGVGMEETASIENLIYPNPTTGSITLNLREGFNGLVKVYDALGVEVFSQPIPESRFVRIDLPAHLDDGVYILALMGEKEVLERRIILHR